MSFSGIIFFIISAGTVVSSLLSDRLTRRLGVGAVTAISVGMTATAYVGNCLMPPFFGWISQHISIAVLPYYLMVLLASMVVMHETMLRRTGSR